jgi:hypothetical protein
VSITSRIEMEKGKIMKIKALIAASAIALASVSSGATTFNLGSLPTGETLLSADVVVVPKGSFLDTYSFTLNLGSGIDAAVGVLNFGKTYRVDLSSFSYTLYDNTNNILGTATDDFGFSVASLSSGSYHLNVSGNAVGTSGGKYQGAITVTPVPEPESYAMLLAGLGLMGAIARRRSTKNKA